MSVKGVLLNRGNGTMIDFKLTSSKKLTVVAINKYGASVQKTLIVNVRNVLIAAIQQTYN